MKKFKKLLAIALTAAMTLSMGMTAFAYDVTITQNAQDKGTHTYGAYQIFTGDIAEKDIIGEDGQPTGEKETVLSNIKWGSGITEAGKTALGDAEAYAKSMNESNAAAKAAELAGYLADPEKTGSTSITDLVGGYYLIQDEDGSPVSDTDPTKPAAKTKFILKVLKDETVKVKSSVPSIEKKVQDINDSDATPKLTNLQDSADYDIGDTVPYTVTATIGDGIANFDKYSFQFVDDMSAGLTLNQQTWAVKVGEGESAVDITDKFELSRSGSVWTWAATDIKEYIQDGSKVILTYECTLNENAVIGAAGNPNTVKLKFDNNPNSCGNGTPEGETPEDKNIVFTYKVDVNKITGTPQESEALNGADFTLYKQVGADEKGEYPEGAATGASYKEGFGSSVKADALKDDAYYVVVGNKTGSAAGSTFEFKGVDDGTYVLVETTIPAGYNSWDAAEFTIEAEHSEEADEPELISLTGGDLFSGDAGTVVLADGKLETSIINNEGAVLPSTGGMGTTIFYVLGTVLVLGAGILMVTKRRMNMQ